MKIKEEKYNSDSAILFLLSLPIASFFFFHYNLLKLIEINSLFYAHTLALQQKQNKK